jgi:ATP synthase subunit 6
MCLTLSIFSPLEQFEISAYKTSLTSYWTYPIDLISNTFYSANFSINIYTIWDFLLLISIVLLIQTNLKEKGYIMLCLSIYILLSQINSLFFTEILIEKFKIIPLYENFYIQDFSQNLIMYINTEYSYITILNSYLNIYSVFFCFIFSYIAIYLIYNKTLSNNTNSLIPNLYQILGENLYKISLNLFYSILGKQVSIPEFFIKINTIFIFLILSNIQGMIPYLSTLTSALTNTFFIALALFISIIKTLLDKKGINYFLNLFMPSGCPILLTLLIIPIEIISYSFRLVSLSVRLFANMMAGHTLLKVIVGFSWIIIFSGASSLINIFPIGILFILTLLEFGVALIQAYIFTVLSCIYLRDIFEGH